MGNECNFVLRGSAGWDVEYRAVLKHDMYQALKRLQVYGDIVTPEIVEKVIERVICWRTWERDPTWHYTDLTPEQIKLAREAPEDAQAVQAWKPTRSGRLMRFEEE